MKIKQYDQFLFENIEQEKLKRRLIEVQSDRSVAPRFDRLTDALDQYYCTNLLRIYCAFLSYQQLAHNHLLPYGQQTFRLIQPIVALIESGEISNPFLQLFNHIRQLYEAPHSSPPAKADQHFDIAWKLVRRHLNANTTTICEEALSLLSNYGIYRLNHGDKQYVEKVFAINNEILRVRYSYGKSKQKLPAGLYKNMVVTAFKIEGKSFWASLTAQGLLKHHAPNEPLDATIWATKFTEIFKNYLLKKDRPKYYRFCQAYIAFKANNFPKAYKVLGNPSRLRGMFINMDIRLLHLMVLFELQLTQPRILEKDDVDINKYIDSFRKLIADDRDRKWQLAYHSAYFIEFAQLYRTLVRLYFKYRLPYMTRDEKLAKEVKGLGEKIEACPYSYKEWFAEKFPVIQKASG